MSQVICIANLVFCFCSVFFERNAYSFNWAHIVCCGDHAGQPHWNLDNYTEQFCLPYAPTNEVRPSLTLLRAAQLPSNKAPCLCMLMIPLLIISFRNLPTFHPPSDSWLLPKRRYFTWQYEFFKQNILAPFKKKSATANKESCAGSQIQKLIEKTVQAQEFEAWVCEKSGNGRFQMFSSLCAEK